MGQNPVLPPILHTLVKVMQILSLTVVDKLWQRSMSLRKFRSSNIVRVKNVFFFLKNRKKRLKENLSQQTAGRCVQFLGWELDKVDIKQRRYKL